MIPSSHCARAQTEVSDTATPRETDSVDLDQFRRGASWVNNTVSVLAILFLISCALAWAQGVTK